MNYQGKRWRTIWRNGDDTIGVIDQRVLPHEFKTLTLRSMEDCAEAIRNMTVRGAPLIGATAAYGICFALREDASDAGLAAAYKTLHATRPTAINLKWVVGPDAGGGGAVAGGEAAGGGLEARGGVVR